MSATTVAIPPPRSCRRLRRDSRRLHDERTRSNRLMAKEVRGPVEQMLSVVLPGFDAMGRPQRPQPFADTVPGFFDCLVDERPMKSPIPTVE
jgi:hypothetical protein